LAAFLQDVILKILMPNTYKHGFTLVELLIVIVVIAILASISIVAYNGIQNRAKNVATQSDLRQIEGFLELYNTENGSYPSTGGLSRVYTDANCSRAADSDGYKGADWIPGLNILMKSGLPQSNLAGAGISGAGGCYTYASDGVSYVLSAWNAKFGDPSTEALYRRLGWREMGNFGSNQYYCNHIAIGGTIGGVYTANRDYYKYSYTVSNITSCNETPPAGA
jgi:prepilin-type N-terminal cleavage/methylation domain-containing protein